ncbi:MAG: bifunctional phosphoribosyl-AMP cyclohydrolase/phosphoribosyl-ATP diphosphatase HisIE [Bacteroidetes bacterium]|nr:bifunctional phosphoribosyl-AMP cyclohydrolase/phosphoribosyl-ATP diphosphatase HisIE [Bacteroidota bacterium]
MINIDELNFSKLNDLLPAIIVDKDSKQVLMLGFMNREALEKTLESGKVTFYSRTKSRLWTKGETSGNFLNLVDIAADCDKDTLLITVDPVGSVCHTGSDNCFNIEQVRTKENFLEYLFKYLTSRKEEQPEGSYTTKLFQSGENRIIQKVGEEAIETVIAAKNNDKEELINEISDLIYHLFVLMIEKGVSLEEITKNLSSRHGK